MKKYILLYLKGIAMGAADVVPGVSGGTIAFISGIYEELLSSIKSIDLEAIKLFFTGKWKSFWTKINGTFLVVLLSGIATAIVSTAKLILYLLEHHPILIWSFFFGLVIASAVLVSQKIKTWNALNIISLLIGTGISYYITTISVVADESTNLAYIFLCGMVAICAMILPGISGSFILLLMGGYHLIIGCIKNSVEAVSNAQFVLLIDYFKILGVFGMGCAIGISLFSHVLTWLYKHYHDLVIALLVGFLIGSLNKVWPWKETLLELKETHKIDVSVSPFRFAEITGHEPMILYAILLAIFGFVLVYGLEWLAGRMGRVKEE
jgi:putative membrane protein